MSVSALGGTQVEHLIAIFQAPGTGDWWIAYKDELLGYYPASLFKHLNKNACFSQWYGEVARNKPAAPKGWPKTEMGSGKFFVAGFLHAAYVRELRYYNLSWFGWEPEDKFIELPSIYKPKYYDRSDLLNGRFFLGGSGGKAPGCVWP